jgi:integrase
MMKWAVTEKIIATDPTQYVKVTMPKSEGWHTMTDVERDLYRSHHPIGSKARAAFELLFYTALRCSDARRLGPQHVVGGELRLTQQDGRARCAPGAPGDARSDLRCEYGNGGQHRPPRLPVNSSRPSYTAKGLSNAVKEWCREAGLAHCSAHTIRKGTLTMLADRSRTVHEIAAYGGHKSLRMVETYTKKADQLRLALAAARAFEGTEVSNMRLDGDKKEKKV